MAENAGKAPEKSDAALREEEVLAFWNERGIFEKSLAKDAPKGEFVFYDGPPFATGLPHHGSLLSSVIKDVIPRYKTMRGYYVRRRWGWDTHGLPIENLVEKKLGLKTKKDILDMGLATFNETARSMVLEYVHDWKRYVERIGRWVDYDNSYKTMDNTYIESVWWTLSELHKKGLLYEGRKVLMYCPHCETPLAKAEIAADNTYQDVTEEAVTVKFKVKHPEKLGLSGDVYLLAWTTTPWTLPGNAALAVGSEISYVVVKSKTGIYVLAKDRVTPVFTHEEGFDGAEVHSMRGSELIGLEYEQLFDVPALRGDTSHRVYAADFVTTDEGTGIVHVAPMYGEDDFALGQREKLPMAQLLNANGTYNDLAPKFIRGLSIKEGGREIKKDLDTRGLLFVRENHTHSYPHCWRCGTPLIYNAVPSWFLNIQKVKARMLEENEKINWVPEHLKHGRFGNIVENAPDWTISRNRFWASPLPIWKERGGDKLMVIGSLEELKAKTKQSGNRYLVMRHGESENNLTDTLNSDADKAFGLTAAGRAKVLETAKELKKAGITRIVASPLPRAQETAELVARELGSSIAVETDERLREVSFGPFDGKTTGEYHNFFASIVERFEKAPANGETWQEVKRRVGDALYELERTYQNENILIVSHNGPLWTLMMAARGYGKEDAENIGERDRGVLDPGDYAELDFVPIPHNADYELDFHRPYIDDIVLVDDEDREYERIPEVVDCWVESGAMPFAEYHYPFENKDAFEKRSPGDFIAEYIAQTRTWFYYMHAIGVLLFDRLAFKNVVTTGTILAANGEKISKSKLNYTDPLILIDRFGTDALRLYLMGSPIMQAEDLRFRDEDIREAHNRVIGILWNSYKFYELYKDAYDGTADGRASAHVLDRWVFARLGKATRDITAAMDVYDLPNTVRAIKSFVDDYSTWYVRRSRERVKTAGEDQQYALATEREVLLTLARLIAPITPFIAEAIWRGAEGMEESVHLAAWPEAGEPSEADERLLGAMAKARTVVSEVLEMRNAAKLKVRQPLALVKVREAFATDDEALRAVIAEEVNVQEVIVDNALDSDVWLDTSLTEELRREGDAREFLRAVQDLRKRMGLAPQDRVALRVGTDAAGEAFVRAFEPLLAETANVSSVAFAAGEGSEVSVGDRRFVLTLEKA